MKNYKIIVKRRMAYDEDVYINLIASDKETAVELAQELALEFTDGEITSEVQPKRILIDKRVSAELPQIIDVEIAHVVQEVESPFE